MSDDDGIHLTYYGYEQKGDPDYDSNSAAGIGDHNNDLEAGLSAALSESERLARFGVTGGSTGKTFEYNGMVLRDDDTSPQAFRNIDVYSPAGPGKFGLSSGYDKEYTYRGGEDEEGLPEPPSEEEEAEEPTEPDKVYPGYDSLSDDAKKQYAKDSQNIPEQEKTNFQFNNIAPIDQAREQFPEMRNLSDDEIVKQLAAAYPEIPKGNMEIFAKDPHGSKLIYDEINKGLTPLEQFKKTYPDFVNKLGSDNAIIDWMHDNLHPEIDKDLFKETVSPAHPLFNAAVNGIMGGLHLGTAKVLDWPQAARDRLNDLDDQIYSKVPGLQDLRNNVQKWIQDNVLKGHPTLQALAKSENYFHDFLGALSKSQAEASKYYSDKPTYGGWMGGTTKEVGGIVGQLPEQMLSFGMGLLPGIIYEGTSGWGKAVEEHQRNAFLEGFVLHGGFRALFGLMNNTNSGRLVSGLTNAMAAATQEDIDGLLRGDRDNILVKEAKAGTIQFVMSLLFAHGPLKTPEYKAPEPLPEQLPKLMLEYGKRPVKASSILGAESETPISREDPIKIGEEQFVDPKLRGKDWMEALERPRRSVSFGGGDEFSFKFSKKVNEELNNAAKHQENGEHDKAIESLDRGFALMTPEEKGPIGPKVIRKLDQLTKPNADKPAPEPEDEQFNQYYFSGLPTHLLDDGLKLLYKVYKKVIGQSFRPEWQGKTEEAFGMDVKSQEAESVSKITTVPGDLARAAGVEKVLKKGDRPNVRQNFFNNKTNAELYQMAIDFQEGKPISDPKAQFIYENIYKPWMKALDAQDKAYGVEHETVENYMKQLFPHSSWERPRANKPVTREGGPSFTKHRTMTMREHRDNGDKPSIYNPETLSRLRAYQSELARQRIDDLREAERNREAYNTKATNIPPGVEKGPHKWTLYTAPNKESYYVSDKILPILNAKFDLPTLSDIPIVGPLWKGAIWMKTAASTKLNWNLFHPIHIGDVAVSDAAATSLVRALRGKGRWVDLYNNALALLPGPLGYVPKLAERYIKNRDLVDVFQSKGKGFSDLSPREQANFNDLKEMGYVASLSEERQRQFHQYISNALTKATKGDPKAAWTIGWVARLVSNRDFNHWWFGEMTPRLKAAAMLDRRDALRETHPELWNPANKALLKQAYLGINRDVESRFGEMHMPNMFWDNRAKEMGLAYFLSLGWQAGLIETQGGGVMDLWKNAEHWNEIVDGWKKAGATGATKNMFLDRIAFQGHYIFRALLTGATINWLTGNQVQNLYDMIYPQVWGKDKDGRQKRVNMQFFLREYPAFLHYTQTEGSTAGGLLKLLEGKANPLPMATLQALLNRDWRGKEIGDLGARMSYLFQQGYAPITFENWVDVPDQTAVDMAMSGLGYSPSGRWTSRTTMENQVMAQLENKPYDQHLHDLKDGYAKAFLEKDHQKMADIQKELRKEGLTQRQINNISKTAGVDSSMLRFNQVPKEEQLKDLEQLNDDPKAQKAWLKHASPAVRKEFHQKHPGFQEEMLIHPK